MVQLQVIGSPRTYNLTYSFEDDFLAVRIDNVGATHLQARLGWLLRHSVEVVGAPFVTMSHLIIPVQRLILLAVCNFCSKRL